MPDSVSDTISTTGRVTVGNPMTGEIETPNDRDAYAVELVAGRTYRIDLEGAVTGKGTLADPLFALATGLFRQWAPRHAGRQRRRGFECPSGVHRRR